ncbi:MAG: hypothetical protein ABW219_11485 [Ilumatobacteraceae bacterium]
MSDSSPPDDGRSPGRLPLLVGLVVVALGVVLCASAIMSGGVGSDSSFGGSAGPDVSRVLAGVATLGVGALIVAVGVVLARTGHRPGDRADRFYGAYLDADDDRW